MHTVTRSQGKQGGYFAHHRRCLTGRGSPTIMRRCRTGRKGEGYHADLGNQACQGA